MNLWMAITRVALDPYVLSKEFTKVMLSLV